MRELTYRIGIVAHINRAEAAHTLFDTVTATYMHMDNGVYGCNQSHRRTWQWLTEHHNNADWLVVVEDDAQPVDSFTDQLAQILTTAPTPIVGLYLGHPQHWATHHPSLEARLHQARQQADTRDACFITTQDLIHGVGIAIQTPLVPSMLAHQSTQPFDYHIRDWARTNNHHIALTNPSIIDHADWPTLVNHPDRIKRGQRKAWYTGTRTHWTPSTVTL